MNTARLAYAAVAAAVLIVGALENPAHSEPVALDNNQYVKRAAIALNAGKFCGYQDGRDIWTASILTAALDTGTDADIMLGIALREAQKITAHIKNNADALGEFCNHVKNGKW